MFHPKVSIYISTFNRLEKLKRAIRSVKNQSYENYELLICDDASTDGTHDYIKKLVLEDSKIRYFRSEINKGACENRNIGIFNAQGYFITGLDDDDQFTADRISTFVESWDEKYSFLCADFIEKYASGDEKKHYNCGGVFNYKDILFNNEASNQIFTKTESLRLIGGFTPNVKRLQDWDTWLRLSYSLGRFMRINTTSYIMNHDHQIGDTRVSESIEIQDALRSLMERNNQMYSISDSNYMNYLIDYISGKESIMDSIYWSIKKRKIKPIVKTILRKGCLL